MKTWLLVVLSFFLLYKAFLHASLLVFPLPTDLLEGQFSTVMLDPAERLLRITLSPRGNYRVHVSLADAGRDTQSGFLLYEDKYFYWHPGFNPFALLRGAVCNLRHQKVLMGGSTITMQIAKLMSPRRRTLGAKLIELARALQLEAAYPKKKLLEIYLNLIPMGGNIEGVGAASYLYFGKPAKELSFAESALLIGLPRSPSRFRPDRHPASARQQVDKVIGRVGPDMPGKAAGPGMLSAVIPHGRFPNPYKCPHLISRTRTLGPPEKKHFTVDPRIQSLAEGRLQETVKGLSEEGSFNGAVVVIDNVSMKVLAYVGSPNFADAAHNGQMNGANIQRSPGSLLKPFLYAMGVEKGMVTPRKLLYDIERNYDGYIPANFDRHFSGPVPADEALARSLNVPAVNLEFELGKEGLSSFIRRAHLFNGARAARTAGLSLVLGAYPMTLEELVRLYSVFANGGRLRELIFFEEDAARPNRGTRLLSPESCYIVTEMLSKLERPDLPQSWEFTPNRGRLAFKTGTSFGLRDAWSIGFTPRYTVGVWLGNVNAKGSSALVGIKAAAPLLVSLLNDLTRYDDPWFSHPSGVQSRSVCALSGEPVGEACPARVMDLYIPGTSAAAACTLHQRIWVRRKDGRAVCPTCMTGPHHAYRQTTVEVWPPDVASFLRRRGEQHAFLPVHNPQCMAINHEANLKVRSPLSGGFYSVTAALKSEVQRIPLMAQSSTAETVSWYVDDQLVAHGPPDQVFYVRPVPGLHHATVKDARGHFDVVEFSVRRPL